jgi:hypothetical protein
MDAKELVPAEVKGSQPGPEPRETEDILAAVLTHQTLGAAAETLGLTRSGLWRIMKRPEFLEQYREARRQIVSHAVSHVQQATVQALDTLRKVMKDGDAFPLAQVLAAKTVLAVAVKGVEVEDMEARINAVEVAQREEEERDKQREKERRR